MAGSRQDPIIGSFAGGEVTPYFMGRTDHKRYYVSCATTENFLVLPHGPAERRGGTRFVAPYKDETNVVRLLPFEFSDEQAYVIEAGDRYFRFYMNKGRIETGGIPYEIETPYLLSDVLDLLWHCQSADVMWITHPKYRTRKLSRTGHTAWALTAEETLDGPYLDENTTDTTLAPSAVSGTVTLTASAVTGINGDAGFKATDVGRLVRIRNGSGSALRWGWLEITAWTSPTQVTAAVKGSDDDDSDDLGGTDAVAAWRLGLWSETTGWPSVVTFSNQDRLVYGTANRTRAARIDGSKVGEFNNFTPGTDDSDPIAISIGSNKVNKIRWIVSARALLVGTVGAEFVVSGDTLTAPLTPTNVQAAPHTRHGCAAIPPIEAGHAVLFVQRQGRKIREMKYDLNVDGYVAPEITLLAEQATRSGIRGLAWQQEPWGVAWGYRVDGQLFGCTYLPEQEVTGFHRHPLGGDGMVESIAVIPGGTGADQLWLAVRRTIDGVPRRTIEVMEEPLPLDGAQSDAYYVDCGLSLINAQSTSLTVAAASGSDVSVVAGGAAFGAGDVGREIHADWLEDVRSKGRLRPVRRRARARITRVDDAAHARVDIITAFPPTLSISAGEWRLSVTTVSGLDHLEGATVQILADGGVHPEQVVSGGAVVLDWPASKVHVGLGYPSVLEPMPLEVGAATKRVVDIRLRLLRSLGGWVGRADDNTLEQILFRSISDPLDEPPALFSGDKVLSFPGDWQDVGSVFMLQDQPLPFTVASTIPNVEVSNG